MLPGPEKVDCPDGCGKFGRPVKRRKGHVRGCPCRSCLNGRNSSEGKARHRKFAKLAGIHTTGFNTSQEEAWTDPFRWEVKSGAQVQPIITRYLLARAQSDEATAIGNVKPFAFGVKPTRGGDPSLVVVDAEVWRDAIVPLQVELDLLRAVLEDIAVTAEDHLDYDTPGWHSVYNAATEALK